MSVEQLRLAIYRGFAETGRAPSDPELAATLGVSEATVRAGLWALHERRHIVLRDGAIVMAHPFSAVPLGFSVMGPRTLWWGGCAWDSFAIPHLVGEEVLVATRCPGCEQALAWNVGTEQPPKGDEVAHFLVPITTLWDDVVHACGNQRLFCDEGCVDGWLARTGQTRGCVLDLTKLWRLAEHWYEGRLNRGYERRDPASAAGYFAAVGLEGRFWGL
ncbi:organomercurial lyase [Embleya sp. NPDC050493]|uniref:organomercurial lyase n=1 Tax=Embleya sp. NPDC050493 TaxID=3363989 RepID=UPI00379A5FA9